MEDKKKKRIAVTGGHGKVGRVLVPYLQKKGYDVFVIDSGEPDSLEEKFMSVDLKDFGQTLDALSSTGEDTYAHAEDEAFYAVIHLASMPHPRMLPDSDEFSVNMMVTFNVFESARRLGIKNIIWSGSEVATGVPYDKTEAPYVPVDEDYPLRGYHVYGLTKVLGEEMARQFCLNDPELRITCLRLSNVIDTEEYANFETWQNDPTVRLWNFWTYVDNRDVAQSIECAIRYDARGMDTFFICNDETVMRTPSEELLDIYYPNVERRKKFDGNEVIISNKKAKKLLGFKPEFHWFEQV